jgi:hypothetical protein
LLLIHWAIIRELMHTVTADIGVDPDRLSFIRRCMVRRQVTEQGFSPERLISALKRAVAEICCRLLPAVGSCQSSGRQTQDVSVIQ